MAYINNGKFKEILSASKDGNEKALMVLQAIRKFEPQETVDQLMNEYYNLSSNQLLDDTQQNIQETVENPVESELKDEIQELATTEEVVEDDSVEMPIVDGNTEETLENPIDLTEILDGELDGLLDENEIEDVDFGTYLKNKSRDGLRARKNSDYFKAYDLEGRTNYLNNKIGAYKEKFNGNLRNIERKYNDVSQSLNNYTQNVKNMLDDDQSLDLTKADSAYKDLTENESVMSSFGRHWDEDDNNVVMEHLNNLIVQYGKQNVLAALNTLTSDNDGYRDYLNNQVDTEIGRYSKSIENLLK